MFCWDMDINGTNGTSIASYIDMNNNNNNNNQVLVSIFWGSLWILNRLVGVSHVYSFPPFYSFWSHTLYYFFNWYIIFYYFSLYYI